MAQDLQGRSRHPDVCIEGDKIEIQYDLIQVTAGQIADKLVLAGASLGGGWIERFRLAFINYQDRKRDWQSRSQQQEMLPLIA